MRDRVGGDGRVKSSSSDMGLTFLELAEEGRLTDFVSVGAREQVALEFREPCSAADCKAGGGRVRFDSEADDELHGLSCAAISVEAAGVRGRVGVGMSLKGLLLFEEDRTSWLLLSALAQQTTNNAKRIMGGQVT